MKAVWMLACIAFMLFCCSDKSTDKGPDPDDSWDIDTDGIPKFVATDYIELDKIDSISKFRSSVGHDYSDAIEHCRSMKHYYKPKSDSDWAAVKIFSPIAGTLFRVEQEWAGTRVEIASESYPAFHFLIFHINPTMQLAVNGHVAAGQQLGLHTGSQTMSDIAVIVNDPSHQGRMVSYFQVMTDGLFAAYAGRGVASRDSMMISREQRDANPLECSGDAFTTADTLENWVRLE